MVQLTSRVETHFALQSILISHLLEFYRFSCRQNEREPVMHADLLNLSDLKLY